MMLRLLSVSAAALLLSACGGGAKKEDVSLDVACPTGSTTLRYLGGGDGGAFPGDFGKSFFDNHCIRCHATGAADPGATLVSRGAPFTTLAGIQAHSDHILGNAGAGQTRVNRTMPPDGTNLPTDEQRRQLAQWIVCAGAQ